jgi:guanylate kinase
VLLLIDVQGAKQVKRLRQDAVFIFLTPPSKEELERRLRKRGTDSKKEIQKRLWIATRELVELNDPALCDYRIVNRDLHKAEKILKAIIDAERKR